MSYDVDQFHGCCALDVISDLYGITEQSVKEAAKELALETMGNNGPISSKIAVVSEDQGGPLSLFRASNLWEEVAVIPSLDKKRKLFVFMAIQPFE